MFTITLQFETLDELRNFTSDFLSTDGDMYVAGPNNPAPAALKPVDTKVEQAAPAEVVKVENTKPARKPEKAAPAKKATKGTAQKKNEAQARAAAKLKQQEQEAVVQEGDLTALTGATPAPTAVAVTKADVDKALRAYASQYQLTGARALLAQFGVQVASALQESQYAAFVAAAQKPPVEA